MFEQVSAEFFIPAKVTNTVLALPIGHFNSVGSHVDRCYLNEHVGRSLASAAAEKKLPSKVVLGSDEDNTDAPAAGWFKNLMWSPAGLVITDLMLTKRAQELIANREYIYFAPVFYADGGIPKDLIGLVLTNNPQLRRRAYGR